MNLVVLAAMGALMGVEDAPPVLKGRLEGYRGLLPFHVFVLKSPDFGEPGVVVATGTADAETGRFDIPLPLFLTEIHVYGQLDIGRQGPTLIGEMVFPLRKLPLPVEQLRGVRHVFDLGDMELAHLVRDRGPWAAVGIAAGLAVLLFGVGALWARRLPRAAAPYRAMEPPLGPWAWLIAIGTTLLLLPGYGAEPPALLEFTYAQEAFRPASAWALLFDPISAELSHPPLWALVLRGLGALSRHEAWLRLPAILAHIPFVLLVFVLGRHVHLGGTSATTPILAAALAGLLPVGFWYARDATPYSLLGLISAATLWFALTERWKAFAGILVAGFFLHYTVAVLGICVGIGLFWETRRTGERARFRRALVAFAWVIPLPLAWSVHFIRTFLASGMSTRLMALDYSPDPGFLEYVRHFASVVLGLPPALWFLLPASLLLLVVGTVRLLRHGHPFVARAALIQVVMVIGYVLFIHQMYMAFAAGRVYYAYRWTTVFLPGVVLAMAAGLDGLRQWRPWAAYGAATVQLGLALYQDVLIVTTPQRPAQWDAFALLRAEARPGDAFCALPAVYFAQTMNYTLFERYPQDLLALPRWSGPLYGPIHPVNTTVETVVQNLAFQRVWVAAFAEDAFGTPEFDPATTEQHLTWLRSRLEPDGTWHFPFLTLHRFRVLERPEVFWNHGQAVLDFSKTIEGFRYFPELLHTQQTGYAMSQAEVAVRIPSPPGATRLALEIEMRLSRPATQTDLTVPGLALRFTPTFGGGIWTGDIPVTSPRTDLRLVRTAAAARAHRNTVLRFTTKPP